RKLTVCVTLDLTSQIVFPVIRTLLQVLIGTLHPTLRPMQRDEAEARIQSVRVFGCQSPASETLQFRMRQNHFHQTLRQALAEMFRKHKNVRHPGKRRIISDDACESDLIVSFVDAERKGVLN